MTTLSAFVAKIARMTTDDEQLGDMSGDDAVSTLSSLIEEARELRLNAPALEDAARRMLNALPTERSDMAWASKTPAQKADAYDQAVAGLHGALAAVRSPEDEG